VFITHPLKEENTLNIHSSLTDKELLSQWQKIIKREETITDVDIEEAKKLLNQKDTRGFYSHGWFFLKSANDISRWSEERLYQDFWDIRDAILKEGKRRWLNKTQDKNSNKKDKK